MSTQQIRAAAAAATSLVLASLGGCASVPTSTTMPIGNVAVAPAGFASFCEREPQECGIRAAPLSAEAKSAVAEAGRFEWAGLFGQEPAALTNVTSWGGPAPAASAWNWAATFAGSPDLVNSTMSKGADVLDSIDLAAPELYDVRFEVEASTQDPSVSGADSETPSAAVTGQLDVDAGSAAGRPLPGQHPTFGQQPTPLVMDRALADRLDRVNRTINAAIQPGDDLATFGQADFWALPLSRALGVKGNCKHYVLEKRRALVEQGVPPEALSVAIVQTRAGEMHAVLLVSTDRGDFVLDNLSSWITPWRSTGYTWLERQAPGAPMEWRTLASTGFHPIA